MKQTAFQNIIFKKKPIKTIQYFNNPLPGIEVGIPLTITQNVFTNLHYGYDITTPKILFLQFSFSYLTYGIDRFNDAFDPGETNKDKQNLYKYYIENKNSVLITLLITYLYTCYLLGENIETIPFILVLTSTLKYKDYKVKLGPYKPLFIAIMWTLSCYVLPCVLNDNDYTCLESPLDYLPLLLTLFGSSNLVDSKDVIEDKNNNITTIPVLYGEESSNTISVIALTLSSILFLINPNYHNRDIINTIYNIQNIGLATSTLIQNKTIININ